jgi:tRNA U34 5-methylaminomethyl-2-thiouridine-forming methyltransferase MnmC
MHTPSRRPNKHTVRTVDGSSTLYSAEFDEYYHSLDDGALHESLTKHVIPALTLQKEKKELTILDICFGLGYNTLATLHYLQREELDTRVHIYSPEFDEALVRSLDAFEYPTEFDPLLPVIEAVSRDGRYEDENVTIEVLFGDARHVIDRIDRPIDIVYQDAFSPAKNPLLWTQEWFADVRALCRDDAILTTYSIAASIRLGLHENGFKLYEYRPHKTRRSLIATPSLLPALHALLPDLSPIDMVLKIARNLDAHSLRDEAFNL